MNDKEIIELYNEGYSIDYISKVFYWYKNRKSKPVILDGVKLYLPKIYTKNNCKLYVMQLIYSFILNKDTFF